MNSEWQSLQPQTQQELKNTMNAMQPPQSVEEVKATLETTEKGGVRQSIRNCLTVFQRDPVLAGAIAYNILTDRKDIIKPIGFHRESTALNDTDMKYLLLYLEETYGLTNEKKIDNAIGIVANENKYHPIRDYLNTLVWDGTERIRFCLRHFLGADADDYTYEALKLFLLGAISRAFQPGCKFEIMLCLVGGQGAGKSTFFRLLAVRDEWFSDDLRKLDDDNVYRKLQGHWIIEMSEMMATANAKSIEEIKSFLSRQKEVYKIPYETHPADRPRQCVFGGTSNALDFLPLDRSGNRRFIPVMVYPEQAEVHILEDEAASRAYIEQMWAEAMEIYRSGRFKLAFSPAMQRYLKEHQRDFMPEDTKAGMIQAYLDKYTGNMVCSKQLYKEALNHAFDEPKQWEIREINEIMNQCIDRWRYFQNPRMFSEYGRQGYNEMLQASDNSQTRETAATMGKHISRMENYVSSMSNLRRMEDTQPDYKLIDLQPLVSSLYDSAKIVCTKNGKELILQNDIPILQLSLDSAFISQVCNNLISNAVRYARTLVTISFALHDNGLLLSVSDDGNGFDKDSLQKAANPYFTGESNHSEHFGLGLYICKLLCEHHNGYLRIENTEVGAKVSAFFKTPVL